MTAAFAPPLQNHWKGFGTYGTVGLELAVSVLGGLFGGQWLDEELGTGGVLTVAGMIVGAALGYRVLWHALRRANREAEQRDAEEKAARRDYHQRRRKP